jgi:type VI secretion system protein ImpL
LTAAFQTKKSLLPVYILDETQLLTLGGASRWWLHNKWRRILEELKAYENKRPDNSLSSLEVAITSDLVEIDLKKCFETIMKKQNNYPSGDFFMNRQVELKQGILARCEILQRNQSIRNYQKLSSFFNENLKQKFPFVLKATNTTPEAEPEDIKEFFKIYKEAGDAPKVILDQIYQLEPEGLGGYRFLESMEKVKFLFEPYLLSKNPADVPGFDFTINFRTNQSREMKGNLIIDWWVMSDEFTKISNYDKDRTGKWLFGNEFILGLRWPKVSQLQPYTDPAQVPIMTVEEGVTQFSYKGRWSLLWMLRNQQAPSSDYSPVTNPFPYVLKFNIPNGPTEKTIVYSTITLLRPSKTVKLGKPMRLPDFPEYAPMLPESVLNKRDDPILLNKSKEGSEP